jgi:hypothetical protein
MKEAIRVGMRSAKKIIDPAFESLKGCDRVAILNPYTMEVVIVLSKDGEFKPQLKSGIVYNPTFTTIKGIEEYNDETGDITYKRIEKTFPAFEWQRQEGSYHSGYGKSYYFEVDYTDDYYSKCPPINSKDGKVI